MKNIKQYSVPVLACFLPVILGVCIYNDLPEMIPTHFNWEGIADGYSSKAFAVFGIPLMLAALQVFCLVVMNSDPKKENYPRKLMNLTVWIVPVLSCIVHGIIFMIALGKDVRVEVIVPALVGFLLIVIGNYLPKTRQNYTMGIKLPWTLDSEENWRKTHRLAGFLMVFAGFWMIFASFMNVHFCVMFAPVFVSVLLPIIYSYLLYQKKGEK